MQYIYKAIRFIKFIFTSRHTMGFNVHSPYIFRIIRYVIHESNPYYIYYKIERIRKQLLNNNSIVDLKDYGTGKNTERIVSKIASKSLKSKKYGQLLFRLVKEHQANTIVELGTSLGITTMYLATASNSTCYSFEGSEDCIDIAKASFEELGISNINIIEGDINFTLKQTLSTISMVDFAFIDANHNYEAVLNYFDLIVSVSSVNAIIVIDDINWSKGMNKAWETIKSHNAVQCTVDLFELGIVFLDSTLNKKHYKLLY